MSYSSVDEEAGQTRKLRPDDLAESRNASTTASMATDRHLVHSVAVPPAANFWSQIKDGARDIFFADEPLRPYNQYQGKQRWKAYLLYLVPILDWLPKYELKMLQGDIIAGLTITSLTIPQDLGYARLAHLPPINGLYSSFVPPLIYSMLGSSKHMVIGPVAVVSILLAQMLKHEIDPDVDPAGYMRLALTATFFSGVVQASFGILRLGFLIDFLSHAAIVGFMSGAAVAIAIQQTRGLLGIRRFTSKTDIVSVMRSIWSNTDRWNWRTICLGLFFLAFLVSSRRLSQVRKKLFWIAAIAPLASVIVSTLFLFLTRLDNHGVKVVGRIKNGVNPPSLNDIHWSGSSVEKGFKIGLVAGLVALTEGVAIARTFAALGGYRIDGNKEMIACGTMNIVGSWTSCFVTAGSFSRTAVNYNSGCHTAVSNIIMSIAVLFTLLFLTPLFRYTPICILAAIIINAVVGLIDIRSAYVIWKTDKVDFLVMAGAFLGVIFVSVEIGLLIAVVISFAKILLHVTRPHTAVLGNIPGTNVYRNIEQYPLATSEAGIVIVRIDASIYFSNSNYVLEKILRYVSDAEEEVKAIAGAPIQFVILDMAPVMTIDTAAIHAFEELHTVLQDKGIQLTISNPVGRVITTFKDGGFVDLLGQEWFFLSVSEGVQVCSIMIKRNQHAAKEKFADKV